jgi:predicted transcriptional regulator
MNELEIEIGRTLGPSCFFVYQTLKHNSKLSLKDLEVESGMTDRQLKVILKNLIECGIVTREKVFLRYCKGFLYSSNEQKETWKFH